MKAGDEVRLNFPESLSYVYWMRSQCPFPEVVVTTTKADALSVSFCPVLYRILKAFPTGMNDESASETCHAMKAQIGDFKVTVFNLSAYRNDADGKIHDRASEIVVQLTNRLKTFKEEAIAMSKAQIDKGLRAVAEMRDVVRLEELFIRHVRDWAHD